MKILKITTSDISGGAAIACYRLFKGLQKMQDIDIYMLVKNKLLDDPKVFTENKSFKKIIAQGKTILDFLPTKLLETENKIIHSPAIFSSLNIGKIAEMNPDIVHLHWICGGFVSVKDLKKLAEMNRPIVWTLHDMWAFCGAEHYAKNTQRYIEGYNKKNRPDFEKGLDLNKWIWKRKIRHWENLDLIIITPSRWLASCANKSKLFKNKKIKVIPNGINTKVFKPIDKKIARDILSLPKNKKLILFGAMNATGDPRKGFEFTKKTMQKLSKKEENKNIELVVFGASEPEKEVDFGFDVNYLGKISDETSLALMYSAVDVFATPSLEDNLPNTVMESLACGNACVGFNVGGIPDMIDHKENGYLAKYKSPEDLANGIEWVLNNDNYENLCKNAREKAIKNFDSKIIAGKYKKLYEEILR